MTLSIPTTWRVRARDIAANMNIMVNSVVSDFVILSDSAGIQAMCTLEQIEPVYQSKTLVQGVSNKMQMKLTPMAKGEAYNGADAFVVFQITARFTEISVAMTHTVRWKPIGDSTPLITGTAIPREITPSR